MSHALFNVINTFLALLGVAAVFGALNKMRWGTTRPCMILATGLIGIGLAGQALGLIKEEWAYYADTALYGGVLALIVASQRVHTWFLERWANPIATCIATLVGILLLVGMLGCQEARAQEVEKPVLVVALDKLDGTRWARTVMLASPLPNGAHVGVILNKPTQHAMGDVFPDHQPSVAVTDPVYRGGPVSAAVIFAITKADQSPGGFSVQLMPGIWLMTNAEVIDAFIESTPNAARYYMGIVVWKPGELVEEVRKGQVMLRDADPSKLFLPDTSGLYDELVTPSRKPPLES